ncbi:sodium-dependent transporter [uncultured Anaerococcus sp.]|uniref:sodium-dependent transporter n=1 Tax=uncultured Anaerococcus sp. TaxID=293428 RepID=UPI0026143A40|nr:sodium-dependent transporter [uncultured Anaerococcus sp.]
MTENKVQSRDGFTSKWGFILSCIGSAVGMGNLWRLPVMVSQWGGMTFLLPFMLFVVLIGSTGVIEEFSFGRAARSGPVGAFGLATEKHGNRKLGEHLGIIPILASFALAVGYLCVMGWIFKYTFMAINGNMYSMGSDMTIITETFENSASAWGNNGWIIIAVLVSLCIMSMGIANGIEKANKFLIPSLFGMFLLLAIYMAFQNGSTEGYHYIFKLNPKGLRDIRVWIFAFGQAFFSLSISGNGSIIYGSYLNKNEDIPNSALYVVLSDILIALLSSLVIIPAMAIGGAELNEGGPGLMFIYLVSVVNKMNAGRFIGIVLYTCILFAGISSIINLFEAPVAYIEEKFKVNRKIATCIINISGLVIALSIQGIVGAWMDAVSIFAAPLGALLAGIMFFWLNNREWVESEVNTGASKPIGRWFYPLGKYMYCLLTLIALIAGIIYGGIG